MRKTFIRLMILTGIAVSVFQAQEMRSGKDTAIAKDTTVASDTTKTSVMRADTVQYTVNDLTKAVSFYQQLNFIVDDQAAVGIVKLSRGNLHLVLTVAADSGGLSQRMPNARPANLDGPNRVRIAFTNLSQELETLRQNGIQIKNNIVSDPGGKYILLEDPSGNPVELFESPAK